MGWLKHFAHRSLNFTWSEKVRNLASIFDPIDFMASWFENEATYVKSKGALGLSVIAYLLHLFDVYRSPNSEN